MKKCVLLTASLWLLVCSVQAVTLTNMLAFEWQRDASVATNPWQATIGEWIAQYDTDGAPPYITLTNYWGKKADVGGLWFQGQCAWHKFPNDGNAPQVGHDWWNPSPTGAINTNDLQLKCQTINISNSTISVGWIVPSPGGQVEEVHGRWKTTADAHWGYVNVFVDHVRSDTIIDTLYSYTSPSLTTNAYNDIVVSTPFSVQAGDIIYLTFQAKHEQSSRWYEFSGTRGGFDKDYRIVFTPIPEPAVCTVLLTGLFLLIRKVTL